VKVQQVSSHKASKYEKKREKTFVPMTKSVTKYHFSIGKRQEHNNFAVNYALSINKFLLIHR